MADKYQQEGNSDFYAVEDDSGDYLLEISTTQASLFSPLAFWVGGAGDVPEFTGPPAGSLALLGVGR